MFKSDLVEQLTKLRPDLPRDSVAKMVATIQSEIINALAKGGRVEIRGFGTFFLSHRGGRMARNPKTGDKVIVQPKWVPRFKAGKKLRSKVAAPRESVSSGDDRGGSDRDIA